MLGFQRPAYSLLLAVVLGLLDWRLGGRFELFGEVLGITTNPSSIFFVLVFLQSFLWRSRRRMSRLLVAYLLVMCAGAGLGMFITADVDMSTSAFIMRLVIPAGIAINVLTFAPPPDSKVAGDHTSCQGDTQKNQDAFGNLAHANVHHRALGTQPARHHPQE